MPKSISRISLRIILRNDAPDYIINFFKKGTKHNKVPSILYTYGFTFNNKVNFTTGTFILFEKVGKNYHLQIEHQFDFNDDVGAPKGYWFTGGLGLYAKDSKMAGYIAHKNTDTQLFGFKNKVVFWHNNVLFQPVTKQIKTVK
jgi:hypothetical protein